MFSRNFKRKIMLMDIVDMLNKKKIIALFTFLIFSQNINYIFASGEAGYENLRNSWYEIFPDGNRNAAGAKFFKYILEKEQNFEKFKEFNKLYCAVSGSLIKPGKKSYDIYLNDFKTNEKISGSYYACCWPCLCDVMLYSKINRTSIIFDGNTEIVHTITIDNPCEKKYFPKEVNRKYFCSGSKINTDSVKEIDGRLVIGYLHNATTCSSDKIFLIDNDRITGKLCSVRNNIPIDKLDFGMGDIFIKLAN